MAKAFKKGMGRLTLPREKKKDKKSVVDKDDDYWDQKPKWNSVFDDDADNQADFISTDDQPETMQKPVLATSARTRANLPTNLVAGSARGEGPNRLTLPRGSSPHASPESKAEVARLEAELSRLKLQLRDKSAGAKQMSVERTAEAFLLNDCTAYPSLEPFASKEKKFALLDKAIANHDGAAMTRIVIWIKHTLRRDKSYMNDLRARPDAMNHYISYLREMKEFEELAELLGTLNRPEEEAFLDYQRTLEQHRTGKVRSEALKTSLKYQFQSQRELMIESELIDEQIRLLEKQAVIVEKDKSNKSIPADEKLKVGDSLSSTLWYANIHHAGEKNDVTAPDTLISEFSVRESENDWMVLTALAKHKNWDQIEVMVRKTSGFLGALGAGVKYVTSIKLPNLVNLCGYNKMPIDRLRKFILAIDDIDERKTAARKWNDHSTALDCFIKTKDIDGLKRHFASIPASEETKAIRLRIEGAIKDPSRWG